MKVPAFNLEGPHDEPLRPGERRCGSCKLPFKPFRCQDCKGRIITDQCREDHDEKIHHVIDGRAPSKQKNKRHTGARVRVFK